MSNTHSLIPNILIQNLAQTNGNLGIVFRDKCCDKYNKSIAVEIPALQQMKRLQDYINVAKEQAYLAFSKARMLHHQAMTGSKTNRDFYSYED